MIWKMLNMGYRIAFLRFQKIIYGLIRTKVIFDLRRKYKHYLIAKHMIIKMSLRCMNMANVIFTARINVDIIRINAIQWNMRHMT
mgnify:CR=1 FL=1